MIQMALEAFAGCFAALVAMELTAPVGEKLLRLLAAFLLGVVLAILFGLALGWVLHALSLAQ